MNWREKKLTSTPGLLVLLSRVQILAKHFSCPVRYRLCGITQLAADELGQRAGVPYFRIYDLRSTYATRLSAGGVADEWVTQLLRQGDAKVFKKYSQMKLQMKREALEKMNRQANEMPLDSGTATIQ